MNNGSISVSPDELYMNPWGVTERRSGVGSQGNGMHEAPLMSGRGEMREEQYIYSLALIGSVIFVYACTAHQGGLTAEGIEGRVKHSSRA